MSVALRVIALLRSLRLRQRGRAHITESVRIAVSPLANCRRFFS
jgi:hypothetical protein